MMRTHLKHGRANMQSRALTHTTGEKRHPSLHSRTYRSVGALSPDEDPFAHRARQTHIHNTSFLREDLLAVDIGAYTYSRTFLRTDTDSPCKRLYASTCTSTEDEVNASTGETQCPNVLSKDNTRYLAAGRDTSLGSPLLQVTPLPRQLSGCKTCHPRRIASLLPPS